MNKVFMAVIKVIFKPIIYTLIFLSFPFIEIGKILFKVIGNSMFVIFSLVEWVIEWVRKQYESDEWF